MQADTAIYRRRDRFYKALKPLCRWSTAEVKPGFRKRFRNVRAETRQSQHPIIFIIYQNHICKVSYFSHVHIKLRFACGLIGKNWVNRSVKAEILSPISTHLCRLSCNTNGSCPKLPPWIQSEKKKAAQKSCFFFLLNMILSFPAGLLWSRFTGMLVEILSFGRKVRHLCCVFFSMKLLRNR